MSELNNIFKVKSRGTNYLKSVLKGTTPFDADTVLKVFRCHYQSNADKYLAIHGPSPTVRIGTADYGSRCFFVNDMSVSAKLDKPSDLARIAEACRQAIERDEPEALTQQRRKGIEVDHQNPGGFAAINKLFVLKHTPKTILQHIAKPNGSSRYCLTEPLLSKFIELHRQQTDNWALLKALPRAEHQVLTKKRRLDDVSE
eukprot:SAG25_NODE_164_length_13142_cov_11.645787_9_plen_200_part_00